MKTVVYISRAETGFFQDQRSIDAMVRFANANNMDLGLSGYLLVAMPFFLQRLEGPAAPLDRLIAGIRGDRRHKDFIVVEEKRIDGPSYANWAMRSFDTVKSTDSQFEAVSFVVQMLSKGLSMSSRTIHPTFFDQMLQGLELQLKEETHYVLVVTVALGPSVLQISDQGEPTQSTIDVPLVNAVVDHIHRKLCPLNPEGRGLVSMYGGQLIQVGIRYSEDKANLLNKVVRACAALVSGDGDILQGNVRCSVEHGQVTVKHLSVDDNLRKGRFMFGAPLTSGLQSAKDLLQSDNVLVICESLANAMKPEFVTRPTFVDGRQMRAVEVYPPLVPRKGKVQVVAGTLAENGDTAVTVLIHATGAGAEPVLETQKTNLLDIEHDDNASTTSSAAMEETDLEWMYQLDNMSKAFIKYTAAKKNRRASRRMTIRPRRREMSVVSQSSCDHQLLTLIYISRKSDQHLLNPAEIADLGAHAAAKNKKRSITGFMIYTKPYFMQYLEGPPAEVKALYATIRKDPRHHSAVIVMSRLVTGVPRAFASWDMKTVDLDGSTAQEMAPLREVLRLLSRHFNNLQLWLPRLQNDLLLSGAQLAPGAYARCGLVVFAALLHGPDAGMQHGPMLNSLLDFLLRGGELLGYYGPCLVGYTFYSGHELLMDEVEDLCADFAVHVGVCRGEMLLVNAGADPDRCDLAFYGPLFERAQGLAARAAKHNVDILADRSCEIDLATVVWEPMGEDLVAGRLEE